MARYAQIVQSAAIAACIGIGWCSSALSIWSTGSLPQTSLAGDVAMHRQIVRHESQRTTALRSNEAISTGRNGSIRAEGAAQRSSNRSETERRM